MHTNHLVTSLVAAAIALGALATGCTPATALRTPPGFVQLDRDGDYGYRATNAEGVVIAVRELDNDPRGDLDFWTVAVDARLRRTYTAQSAHEVESDAGLPGRQIRYRAVRGGRPHVYWATVFVDRDRVLLVEAGGDEAFFAESREAVERAVLSL